MGVRPIRSAMISFGLVSIPVRFYTATHQEDVSFNLLHGECGSRVNRKWWCPRDERIIEADEMIRGYQIRKGTFVTFSDEEIEALETDDNRSLDITEFVDLNEIDPVYFEKAYFIGPAPGGAKTYHLLSEAMKKQNKVGIARWVSARKEHLVILRPFANGLILHTMYYADEVRDFGQIEADATPAKEKEIKLAEMLINELTEEKFDPLKYRDDYRERLLEKIEAKSRGEQIITSEGVEEKGGGEVVDIMEALRRSLEGAKPARRARATDEEKRPAEPAKKKKSAVAATSEKEEPQRAKRRRSA